MEIDDQKKKSVNNYQQLATICERLFKGSTIINNYQQLFLGWSTIINNYQQFARGYLSGQQLSTITNNCFGVVNNYQQLPTIFFFLRSTIINNYQQLATIFFAPVVAITAVVKRTPGATELRIIDGN